MYTFAERLNELMLEKNIKVEELSAAIGISPSNIYAWKRDEISLHLSKLLKLTDFFDCSLEFLTGRSNAVLDYKPQPCPPFYLRLRDFMIKFKVSGYKLQKHTSIGFAYLRKWEHGADPRINSIISISDFFGITLDYLVGRDR